MPIRIVNITAFMRRHPQVAPAKKASLKKMSTGGASITVQVETSSLDGFTERRDMRTWSCSRKNLKTISIISLI